MAGFPGLGLLRRLRPTRPASADDGPARRPRWRRGPWEGPPGWFPRSLSNRSTGRRPAMPLRHRHGYAADLHRGLPTGDITQPRSSPPRQSRRVRAAPSPDPPGSSWWRLLRGFRRWFLTYTFPSCLPDPGHLAVLARPGVVRAAFHPPRRLPDRSGRTGGLLRRTPLRTARAAFTASSSSKPQGWLRSRCCVPALANTEFASAGSVNKAGLVTVRWVGLPVMDQVVRGDGWSVGENKTIAPTRSGIRVADQRSAVRSRREGIGRPAW